MLASSGAKLYNSVVQYAFHPGEVTEQVGKLFQLSFEPKIRLVCFCSASVTSCLQARDCTVVYLYISQVTFAAVLLRLRQCNSLGQNTDIVSADTTAMQFYEFLNLCLVEVPNVTHSGHS